MKFGNDLGRRFVSEPELLSEFFTLELRSIIETMKKGYGLRTFEIWHALCFTS